MPIMFNSLLREAGLSLADVRLLRHQDTRARRGCSPYELWRDDRPAFDRYQSTQSVENRPKFANSRYWACFLGTPEGLTLFAGLYSVAHRGLLDHDLSSPTTGDIEKTGSCDLYDVSNSDLLVIEWGEVGRSCSAKSAAACGNASGIQATQLDATSLGGRDFWKAHTALRQEECVHMPAKTVRSGPQRHCGSPQCR